MKRFFSAVEADSAPTAKRKASSSEDRLEERPLGRIEYRFGGPVERIGYHFNGVANSYPLIERFQLIDLVRRDPHVVRNIRMNLRVYTKPWTQGTSLQFQVASMPFVVTIDPMNPRKTHREFIQGVLQFLFTKKPDIEPDLRGPMVWTQSEGRLRWHYSNFVTWLRDHDFDTSVIRAERMTANLQQTPALNAFNLDLVRLVVSSSHFYMYVSAIDDGELPWPVDDSTH